MTTLNLEVTDQQLAALQAAAKTHSTPAKVLTPTDVMLSLINRLVANSNSRQAQNIVAQYGRLPSSEQAKIQAILAGADTKPAAP